MVATKKLLGIYPAPQQHWVGDGFPVRSLFSYHDSAEQFSPFLLLDYAGPMDFEPADRPRGVGEHPHRGFETVTIVYQGEVAHRDSSGAGGTIGPGDVQWMTAASGILHDEFHSPDFTRTGGTLEMIQLWVNLPAKDKLSTPRYQHLSAIEIPSIALPDNAGEVRVIAGEYRGQRGPADTFTAINLWDMHVEHDRRVNLDLPDKHTVVLVVRRGGLQINGRESLGPAQTALWGRPGTTVSLRADIDTELLLLSGEPIDEPIVGQGPFVMNSRAEIQQAIADFQHGRFGQLP